MSRVASKIPCFVCGRAKGSNLPLPSGSVVPLCQECAQDSFKIKEAERRVLAGARP